MQTNRLTKTPPPTKHFHLKKCKICLYETGRQMHSRSVVFHLKAHHNVPRLNTRNGSRTAPKEKKQQTIHGIILRISRSSFASPALFLVCSFRIVRAFSSFSSAVDRHLARRSFFTTESTISCCAVDVVFTVRLCAGTSWTSPPTSLSYCDTSTSSAGPHCPFVSRAAASLRYWCMCSLN